MRIAHENNITHEICKAFLAGEDLQFGTSYTNGQSMTLFGAIFAWWNAERDTIKVTLRHAAGSVNTLLTILGVVGGVRNAIYSESLRLFGSYQLTVHDVISVPMQNGRAVFTTPDEIMAAYLLTAPPSVPIIMGDFASAERASQRLLKTK